MATYELKCSCACNCNTTLGSVTFSDSVSSEEASKRMARCRHVCKPCHQDCIRQTVFAIQPGSGRPGDEVKLAGAKETDRALFTGDCAEAEAVRVEADGLVVKVPKGAISGPVYVFSDPANPVCCGSFSIVAEEQ